MRRSSLFFILLLNMFIMGFEHLQAQTLQVALSPAPKVNRTTSGGTATIYFDSNIVDLSIICTEENPNEVIKKINDHLWFVNIDVNKDIEADGICYRNYLLKCSASAEYFLTTDLIVPNQVLYYTITLPNELEPQFLEERTRNIVTKANALVDEGDSYLARILALEALPPNLPYTVEAEAALRMACKRDNALLKGHGIQVLSVAFSPDGKHLASGAYDKTIRIWDRFSGMCMDTLMGHRLYPKSVEYTKDGRYIISRDEKDEDVIVWNALSGKDVSSNNNDSDSLIMQLANIGMVTNIAPYYSYSSDFKFTANVENQKNHVVLKDLSNHSHIFSKQRNAQLFASYSKDGKQLLTASNSIIYIWDVQNGICVDSLIGHRWTVSKAVYSNDGRNIVSASIDKTVRIWNAKTKKIDHVLNGHTSKVISALFSNNGKFVASASADSTVRIWDVSSGKCIRILRHDSPVNTVVFDKSDKLVITGTAKMDNKIRLWDVVSGLCIDTLNEHKISITSIACSPDGQLFASASASSENSIRIWDSKTHKNINTLTGHTSHVLSVSFSNDGSKLVSASDDKTIRVWDVKSGTCLVVFDEHSKSVSDAEFCPDNEHIVSASLDGTIRVWDFPSLQKLIKDTRERFKDRKLTSEEKARYNLE